MSFSIGRWREASWQSETTWIGCWKRGRHWGLGCSDLSSLGWIGSKPMQWLKGETQATGGCGLSLLEALVGVPESSKGGIE